MKASLKDQLSVQQLRQEFRRFADVKLARELPDFYLVSAGPSREAGGWVGGWVGGKEIGLSGPFFIAALEMLVPDWIVGLVLFRSRRK